MSYGDVAPLQMFFYSLLPLLVIVMSALPLRICRGREKRKREFPFQCSHLPLSEGLNSHHQGKALNFEDKTVHLGVLVPRWGEPRHVHIWWYMLANISTGFYHKRQYETSTWCFKLIFNWFHYIYIYMKKMKINNKVKAIAIPTAKAKIWRKMSWETGRVSFWWLEEEVRWGRVPRDKRACRPCMHIIGGVSQRQKLIKGIYHIIYSNTIL